MTNKEVIEILEHLKPSNQVYTANDAYAVGQALCIAIKSLCEAEEDCVSRKNILESLNGAFPSTDWNKALFRKIVLDTPSVYFKSDKPSGEYEYHTDHTDCIWYGNDSGCPVTCSQYRDGWNDAMDYIFKNGKGYQPYRHDG